MIAVDQSKARRRRRGGADSVKARGQYATAGGLSADSPVDPALRHRYFRKRWGWGPPRTARKGLMTPAAKQAVGIYPPQGGFSLP